MRRARLLALVLLALVLVGLAGAAAFAARPIELPAPDGPYAVGRAGRVAEDAERALVVTLYYPAQAHGVPSRYLRPEAEPHVAAALRDELGGFALLPDEWGRLRGHARDDAPLAPGGPFRVVTFAPGLGTQPELYSTLLARLASHGHVVLALAPPGDVPVVVFPDGRVVPEATEPDAPTPEARTQAREARGDRWAADVALALDAAARWNESDPLLRGALDASRVVAMGHSLGGAAAARAAERDARIVASANLDGTPLGAPADAGTGKPALLVEDPVEFPGSPDDLARAAYSADGERVTILGITHETFVADLAIVADRFPFIGAYGDAPRRENVERIGDELLAFVRSV